MQKRNESTKQLLMAQGIKDQPRGGNECTPEGPWKFRGRGGGRGHPAGGVKPVQLLLAKLAGCSDLSAQLFTSQQGGFFLPASSLGQQRPPWTERGRGHAIANASHPRSRHSAQAYGHAHKSQHCPLAALDHRVRSALTGIPHRRTVRARSSVHRLG